MIKIIRKFRLLKAELVVKSHERVQIKLNTKPGEDRGI